MSWMWWITCSSPFPSTAFCGPRKKPASAKRRQPCPAKHRERRCPQPFIFVKDGTKLVKIRVSDILYVEGLKDYVAIHTRQQKIVTLQRLKNLEVQLPADQFIRIHHSYIVSLEGIDSIHKDKVQVGQMFLPISETYRKPFKDFIDRNHLQGE
jgi:two-component system, LytTR family, response regulator